MRELVRALSPGFRSSLHRVQSVSLAIQSVPRWPTDAARSWPFPEASELSSAATSLEPATHNGGPSGNHKVVEEKTSPWRGDGGRSGQCQDSRADQREGEQDSMSHRGHASHPASSRPSSQSPPTGITPSPPSSQPHHAWLEEARGYSGPGLGRNPAAIERDERAGAGPARSSGFQDILNPPERVALHGEDASPPPPRTSAEGEHAQRAMEPRRYGDDGSPPHPYASQSRAPTTAGRHGPPPPAHFNMPPISGPAEPSLPPRRDSPSHAQHPYLPGPNSTRRILTPKSPRVASLSRAAMRSGDSHPSLPFPPQMPRTSVPPHDVSPLGGPPFRPGLLYPGSQAAMGAEPAITRSLSQPILSHGSPMTQEPPVPSSTAAQEQGIRPIIFSPAPQFSSSLPPGRGPPLGPSSGLSTGGESRWSSMGSLSMGFGGSRTIAVAEGQHVLTITPTHGEEIVIPVDMHQASKQADEKRQRNAGASARFRQRKKEREKEQQVGIHRLETINRELEKRLLDAEAERDFYRGERNRYRDIVARTPSISEWAERGPPSPTSRSSRSGGSLAADNSPLPAPQAALHHHPHAVAHQHPAPSSYADPSMPERPARRRRTEPEPQFTTPSYGPPPPTTLPPPMPPQSAYGMSPSPHPSPHPAPAPSARLPPLRLEQPSPSPEYQLPPPGNPSSSLPPPPIPHSQQQHQQQLPPHYANWGRPPPQETGWATEPRGPPESGPR